MNCDDCLRTLQSGTFWNKLRTKWHILHCAKCAAQEQELKQIIQSLTEPVPFSYEDRQLWLVTAQNNSVRPFRRELPLKLRWALVASFATCACLVLLLFNNPFRRSAIVSNAPEMTLPHLEHGPIQSVDVSGEREVAELSHNLNDLQDGLLQVSSEIELLETKQQLNQLLAKYQKIGR